MDGAERVETWSNGFSLRVGREDCVCPEWKGCRRPFLRLLEKIVLQSLDVLPELRDFASCVRQSFDQTRVVRRVT